MKSSRHLQQHIVQLPITPSPPSFLLLFVVESTSTLAMETKTLTPDPKAIDPQCCHQAK